MLEKELKLFQKIQLIILAVNYYLLIWQAVAYKIDGYSNLFNLFITFFCIERFLSMIRGIMLLSFESGCYGVLKGIVLNLVCLDYSIGVDVFYDNAFLDQDKFIEGMNYISHGINVIPLLNNFYIIHERFDVKWIYIIVVIYALILMTLTDVLNFINQQEKSKSSTSQLQIFEMMIVNISKKLCYYSLFSYLYSLNNNYLAIYCFNLIFEISIMKSKIMRDDFLSTSIQISYIPCQEQLKIIGSQTEYFILSSLFQSIIVLLLFLIRISFYTECTLFDNLQYLTFVISLKEIVLSVSNYIKYQMYGPYSIISQIQGEDDNSVIDVKRQLTYKTLSRFLFVNIFVKSENIEFSDEVQSLIHFILTSKRFNSTTQILERQGLKQKQLISFQKTNSCIVIQTLDAQKYMQYIIKILNYELPKTNDCEQSCIKILTRSEEEDFLFIRNIIQQVTHFHTRKILLEHHFKIVIDDYSSFILSYIAFYRLIKSFVPVNDHALLYDLWDY